jgi:hypothetical protein
MPRDDVASEVTDPGRTLRPLALAALVVRCLLVSALISTAAWILGRLLLNQL